MTFFEWDTSDKKAIRRDAPAVGVRADSLVELDAAIAAYEAPFIAAAEAERAAEENRVTEEARVERGIGVDGAQGPKPFPGLEPVKLPQEVVNVV